MQSLNLSRLKKKHVVRVKAHFGLFCEKDVFRHRMHMKFLHEQRNLFLVKVCATSVIKLITGGKKLLLIFHLWDMAMKAKQLKHTTLYVVQNLAHENLLVQECGLYHA